MDAGFASLVRSHLGRLCALVAVAGVFGVVTPPAASAADALTMRIAAAGPNPTSGPLTVTGVTNRAGSVITVTDDQATTVCTATGDTTAVNGWYLFRCAGTVPGGAGQKTLTVKARGPKGNSVTATLTIDKKVAPPPVVPLAVTVTSVSPDPTTGPVTVAGTTTRPSAKITVRNQDGSLLCSTIGAPSAAGVDHAFTCTGEVTGKAGRKTLTIKAVGPNGNTVSTTATVTKSVPVIAPFAGAITSATPDPTTGPISIVGSSNRPGVSVTVKNQDGSTLCSTTGTSTLVDGSYSFSCTGEVTGRPGTKVLSARLVDGAGSVVRAGVTVTKTAVPQPPAAFTIVVASVDPSPTTGRVTVSGTTNRAGAVVTVVNQDNSPLCTAAGSLTKAAGAYAFSCAGDVTGRAGTKTLTIKGIGPNGASARTTVQVTKV